MFNFIAAALMVYLLVNVLIAPGSMTPESRDFAAAGSCPSCRALGVSASRWHSPLNLSLVLALACCVGGLGVHLAHAWGYELRAMGHNPRPRSTPASDLRRMTILAMCLSGALAGLVGVNEIMGVHHRLVLDFPAGYGFVGIAVALMGRNHPVGIVLAALLFGALYQGGAELSFEIPGDHPRHGGGDPGPRDPLLRRARATCRGPGCGSALHSGAASRPAPREKPDGGLACPRRAARCPRHCGSRRR